MKNTKDCNWTDNMKLFVTLTCKYSKSTGNYKLTLEFALESKTKTKINKLKTKTTTTLVDYSFSLLSSWLI